MFDYVKFQFPCPKCHANIEDWETKDGLQQLDILDPIDVGHFYSACIECKLLIHFRLQDINDYVATYEMSTGDPNIKIQNISIFLKLKRKD